MKTINRPSTIKALVEVSSFNQAINTTKSSVYWRVACTPVAVEIDSVWKDESFIMDELTFFRTSQSMFDMYLKSIIGIANNPLIVEFEHTIAGLTEYEKDGEVHTHNETDYVPVSINQCTISNLMKINKSVDISMMIPFYQSAMKEALAVSLRTRVSLED